jgi:hypothetical protein
MSSMASFFNTVRERVFSPEPVPAVSKKDMNLAQKQANIRAACVREGFQAIRARNAEMAQRIEQYKRQRNKTGSVPGLSIDPVETVETIVMSSSDPQPQQPVDRVVNL